MADSKTIKVSILDRHYQVSCGADEVAALKQSAAYLDTKMREMQDRSNLTGIDRLAVMTALNMANELLAQTDKANRLEQEISRIAGLTDKVDSALKLLRKRD